MATPKLDFADKYDPAHAQRYYERHRTGLRRRVTTWREAGMARTALRIAGDPQSVLDIPCGTGRFWELLTEKKERRIYAADLNLPMLQTGLRERPREITERIQGFQTSAFAISLPDNFVECVFCIRLLHHIGKSADRLVLLKELARVASSAVIVSLWIDGNYMAMRWRKRRGPLRDDMNLNRYVIPRDVIETEFRQAGLRPVRRIDFLRFYAHAAMYVLRKD